MKLFNQKLSNQLFWGLYSICVVFFFALVLKQYNLEGWTSTLNDYKIYLGLIAGGHVFMSIPYVTLLVLDDPINDLLKR